MEQRYGRSEPGPSREDIEPDYLKRGRFEDHPPPPPLSCGDVGSDLDRLDVPPATLRVLVRQIDAGGIIGKVSTTRTTSS